MPHPKQITYKECRICQKLDIMGLPKPIVGNFVPQRSLNDINSSRFHNWYFFTLGYSPKFVQYVIESKRISKNEIILDPFVGSGTTVVEAKLHSIESIGIDANDFMVFAASVKTNWNVDLNVIYKEQGRILRSAIKKINSTIDMQKQITEIKKDKSLNELIIRNYISMRPLSKILIVLSEIEKVDTSDERNFFKLALFSILVPVSNVRFGPGFGIGSIREDVDVIDIFRNKLNRMIADLMSVNDVATRIPTKVILGDSRNLLEILKGKKIDHMITSPPYPGDHEYTRHTRLELMISGIAKSRDEFRLIKERMIRGSTRNVYCVDDETKNIMKFTEIVELMNEINRRVRETKGTSGFEKLYSRVVGEYFGGMYTFLHKLKNALRPGGTATFLVGDSHAFKMVHIETARMLGELAIDVGFSSYDLELWWNKRSTSHSFHLPEYILNLKN
jgi:DNA modification methylase